FLGVMSCSTCMNSDLSFSYFSYTRAATAGGSTRNNFSKSCMFVLFATKTCFAILFHNTHKHIREPFSRALFKRPHPQVVWSCELSLDVIVQRAGFDVSTYFGGGADRLREGSALHPHAEIS